MIHDFSFFSFQAAIAVALWLESKEENLEIRVEERREQVTVFSLGLLDFYGIFDLVLNVMGWNPRPPPIRQIDIWCTKIDLQVFPKIADKQITSSRTQNCTKSIFEWPWKIKTANFKGFLAFWIRVGLFLNSWKIDHTLPDKLFLIKRCF